MDNNTKDLPPGGNMIPATHTLTHTTNQNVYTRRNTGYEDSCRTVATNDATTTMVVRTLFTTTYINAG